MILHNSAAEATSNISGTKKGFTIKASAKAFSVLSSNLYKDKVTAVIRELSTNAIDAHKDVGFDGPFNVHLPTELEPFFSIRDFGPGMTPEQIESLYTSFFSSSKSESNDAIGALGLGSKSPFAVVDSFNIESICQGTKSVYTCFKTANGPEILTISQTDNVDDPSGLEISMPISSDLFVEFWRKAANLFWGMGITPVITGASSRYDEYFEQITGEAVVVIKGESWTLYKKYPNFMDRYGQNVYLRMGGIIYPVDSRQINTNNPAVRSILRGNYLIDVPIGYVDIAPSREELSYDDDTCSNIVKILNEVYNDLVKEISKQAAGKSTFWEAMIFSRKTLNEIGIESDQVTSSFVWGGKTCLSTKGLTTGKKMFYAYRTLHRSVMRLSITDVTSKGFFPKENLVVIDASTFASEPNKMQSTYNKGRLNGYLAGKNAEAILLLEEVTDTDLEALGLESVMKWDDLPRRTYQKKGPREKKVAEEVVVSNFAGSAVKLEDAKKTKGKMYVVSRQNNYWEYDKDAPNGLKKLDKRISNDMSRMRQLGFAADKVFILPYFWFKKNKAVVLKSWKPLREVAEKFLEEFFNSGIVEEVKKEKSMEGFTSSYRLFSLNKDVFLQETFSEKSPMRLVQEALRTGSELEESPASRKWNLYSSISTVFSKREVSYYDLYSNKNDPFANIWSSYPLLHQWNGYVSASLADRRFGNNGSQESCSYEDSILKDVVDYIKFIDQKLEI